MEVGSAVDLSVDGVTATSPPAVVPTFAPTDTVIVAFAPVVALGGKMHKHPMERNPNG